MRAALALASFQAVSAPGRIKSPAGGCEPRMAVAVAVMGGAQQPEIVPPPSAYGDVIDLQQVHGSRTGAHCPGPVAAAAPVALPHLPPDRHGNSARCARAAAAAQSPARRAGRSVAPRAGSRLLAPKWRFRRLPRAGPRPEPSAKSPRLPAPQPLSAPSLRRDAAAGGHCRPLRNHAALAGVRRHLRRRSRGACRQAGLLSRRSGRPGDFFRRRSFVGNLGSPAATAPPARRPRRVVAVQRFPYHPPRCPNASAGRATAAP